MSITETLNNFFYVKMKPAGCSVDIGDGSERGEYVCQDYLLRLFHRPHRGVNLMYCYYPYDKGWPQRASIAHKPSGTFAWDYPYDDYFPYEGGPNGNPNGEPFSQIKDIRRHGEDVTLTLTMDCAVKEDEIAFICKELACFGRLRIRLNHECDGNWFAFNKRYSYEEVAQFFIKFSKILKKEAPNIILVSCFGSVDFNTGRLKYEKELTPMLPYADVWSIDRYLTLHYGWPNNICEPEHINKHYTFTGTDNMLKEMERVWEIFKETAKEEKPFEICEINADGDVGGVLMQRKECIKFYNRILKKRYDFLKGITYYQFRDKGRLGLEQEDPNNSSIGIPQPFLQDYKKIIFNPYFLPVLEWQKANPSDEMKSIWIASDDATGIGFKYKLKDRPIFFELKLQKELNLLIKVKDLWYYKRPGIEWLDAIESVKESKRGDVIDIVIFSPPSDGTNPQQGTGWASSVTTLFDKPPELRVRYKWKIPKV